MEKGIRNVPDFLLGGILKSGTTNLDEYLRKHPEIFMLPRNMKYNFFDNNEVFANGEKWYRSLFVDTGDKKLIGQTSADCAFNYESAQRIKSMMPGCKLIFILRNPIDRAYSQYWHQVRMGREYFSWDKAIEKESTRMRRNYFHYRMFSYISRGRYKEQFERYYKLFPKEQVLIIPFEFMIKHELFVVNKVLEYLGLPPVEKLAALIPETNAKKTNPAMLPSSKLALYIAWFIQRVGFIRIGRVFLNKFIIEKRPAEMTVETRGKLEEYYKEDIEFYNAYYNQWEEMRKDELVALN